jgi:hypothetical protein
MLERNWDANNAVNISNLQTHNANFRSRAFYALACVKTNL